MAFNASVNLGTVGNGITGQTVSISGCTGASCGSGCTSLATSQTVSSFPKTITGIPDGTVSLFVKVDGGDCVGTTQCISITGIPGATPTPTSTATPTSTIGSTSTPTSTSTGTPTTTTTPTATTTPTVAAGKCYTYLYSSVPSDLYVRYRRKLDDTIVTETINSLETMDNGDGTYTAVICVSQIGSYNVPVCVQFSNEVTCPSIWELGGNCETAGACFLTGDPEPTPTTTTTPTTTIYTFYRAGEVLDTNISTTYCNNFGSGGQGYLINSPFYTTDATLTPGTTTIYSDYGLTTPVAGSWSLGNVTRMAYITESENQIAQNTPTTTNPNGDLLYDGGTYKFMRVDSNGGIMSVGTDSCSGGPGGPSEA